MSTAALLIPAMILDAIFGEPKWLWSRVPHPAVLMGKLVQALDDGLNDGDGRRGKGVVAVLVLVVTGLCLGWAVSWLGDVVSVLIAAILIAQRSLVDHVRAVATGLRHGLLEGREAVAQIVSRDTANMTGPQVARSAIESGAENFSDGVIAPAFWFLVAGLPGLFIYKLINTADSMIGYRTEAYEEFGWAAARFDDVLNIIPARLSALLLAVVTWRTSEWGEISADARKHRSPNAGWPEAAMARALGVALAGPRSYDGEMRDFAWVNEAGSKSASAHAITRCCDVLWKSWGLTLVLVVALGLLFQISLARTDPTRGQRAMRVLPSAKAVLHRTALIALLSAPTLAAAQCGGSFQNFVRGLKDEAVSAGYAISTVNEFFDGVSQDQSVLRADRSQGVFQKPFVEFSRRLISQSRLNRGRSKGEEFDKIFDRIETTYGINRGVLLAFWAFETDYGAVQGDFNTRNALVTLAHDCRRPDLFRPQIFSALELYRKGDFDPARTTGAWAGEIGMVQMLPGDILEHGVDADGDGHVTLKTSAADALMSAARMLSHLGWRANEPWLQEVTIPADMDVSASGPAYKKSLADWEAMGVAPRTTSFAMKDAEASLLLPQGHKGPAFLAYPNFEIYFEWNQSFTYVLTAAYFATRLEGAPVYDAGNSEQGLSGDQMKELQRRLQARGHDVGDVDGILGANTRLAVQEEQKRLGLPADAWPTPDLLNAL